MKIANGMLIEGRNRCGVQITDGPWIASVPEELIKLRAKTSRGFPAPEPQEIKEAPFCNAESTRNKHGKAVLRLRFESFEALEAYFADELIGSDMMEGSASKAIGCTLLIWDRN